jgi:hypothetical protein
MNMPCRITDEVLFESYLDEEQPIIPKSLSEITVLDLLGEDYNLWITKNKKGGFDVQMELDWDDNESVLERNIHPYAMDNFAKFCKNFVRQYERL